MAERLYPIHTGQYPHIWPSLQMRLGPLVMVFTTLAIGLLTPGDLHFKVVLFNGRNFTLLLSPASCGVIRGREEKSSFPATIRQWLISGLLALPETPISCTSFAQLFFSGATHNFTILVSHIAGTDNSIADSLSRLQMARFRQLAPAADLAQMPIPPSARTLWNVV